MRPGLDKPGALPLLVLIVFSLLTLAPSLSSIYKFADLVYYYPGARTSIRSGGSPWRGRANGLTTAEVPLIKDSVAEGPSEAPTVDHHKSWILAAQHRQRLYRPSRSSRTGNLGAQTVPSEIAPVENKGRLSSASAESSFMFTRRARAFRTYFAQHLDDCQFFASFSTRSLPAKTMMNFFPTPASQNRSPLPTSVDDNHSNNIPPSNDNETTSSYSAARDSGLQFPLYHAWQQVCHAASGFWELTKESRYIYALLAWIRSCSEYAESLFVSEDTAAMEGQNKGISTATDDPNLSETPTSAAIANDQSTDAAGRHTSELRGSCMAVVVGLVVGIMWF